VFNALRWIVRAGSTWRMLPNDLPPGMLTRARKMASWLTWT